MKKLIGWILSLCVLTAQTTAVFATDEHTPFNQENPVAAQTVPPSTSETASKKSEEEYAHRFIVKYKPTDETMPTDSLDTKSITKIEIRDDIAVAFEKSKEEKEFDLDHKKNKAAQLGTFAAAYLCCSFAFIIFYFFRFFLLTFYLQAYFI